MIKAVWDSKTENDFAAEFDTYLAEALLSEGKTVGSREGTLALYDVKTDAELAFKQKQRLQDLPKIASLFYDIEMPLAKILADMEQRGILLDTKQLTKVGQDIDRLSRETKDLIDQETGGGININSPAQLGDFLAVKIGIPLGRTKTGKYATNEVII